MNLGQTMITMGMFILLVMSVISANRMLVQNAETGLQTEALTESATIASDFFQEAQSKLFDRFVDTARTNQAPAEFSPPTGGTSSGWGPSSSEQLAVGSLPDTSNYGHSPRSIAAYNDVDDYDGYTRIVMADTINGVKIGGFLVTVRVKYVDPNLAPDPLTKELIAVNYQTNMKRIEVDIEHPQYLTKITYKSLMSY